MMKQKIVSLCTVPVLLSGVLYAAVKQQRAKPDRHPVSGDNVAEQDQKSVRQLASYPKTAAFDNIVQTHLLEQNQWKFGTTDGEFSSSSKAPLRVFYSTFFQGGNPKVATQCIVNESGKVFSFRYVRDWATQGVYDSPLQAPQLSKLKTALRAMPSNAATPIMDNILIVSFRDGKKWTTRVYDRSQPNPQLAAVYKIIGFPKYSQQPLKTE